MKADQNSSLNQSNDNPSEAASPPAQHRSRLSGMAAALIAAFPGMLFVLIALAFGPFVHGYFDTDPQFIDYSNTRIFYFTLFFMGWAVISIGGGILAGRLGLGDWLARRPAVLSLVFSLHLAFVLLATADGAMGVRGCIPAIPRITFNHTQFFYRCVPAFDRLMFGNDLTYDVVDRPIRDSDLPHPGRTRILFLGDSVVYGDRIPSQTSIPWYLERRLGPEYEVLNAGVLGYGLHNYYYYAHNLIRLKPDMVIVGICLNDLTLSTDRRLTGNPKDPDCGIQTVTPLNKIRWWANLNSGLLNADKAFQRWHFPKNNDEIARLMIKRMTDVLNDNDELTHHVHQIRPYVRELASLMRDNDIPFAAVVFPFQFQYEEIMQMAYPHHLDLQAAVVELFEDQGVPVLDIYEPFGQAIQEVGGDLDQLFLDYNHFTPLGSEKTADIIMPWLHNLLAEAPERRENDEDDNEAEGGDD